jgi:hypothetical protein
MSEDFLKNPDLVVDLVQQRSDAIDTLLNDIWQDFEINNERRKTNTASSQREIRN